MRVLKRVVKLFYDAIVVLLEVDLECFAFIVSLTPTR